MDSRTILEAERIGLVLYVALAVVVAAIVAFGALSAGDGFTALTAGMSLVSGIVVLGIIYYLETRVWNAE